jgi:RNA polymerase sigma factor (sigma-70 family)
MRDYQNTDSTEIFLSDADQRRLIATAQDVPCSVEVDEDGTERTVFGYDPAAEAAMAELIGRFSGMIRNVARMSKVLDYDDAESACYERFIRAVREYDLDSEVPFSRDIRTVLRRHMIDENWSADIVRVKIDVATRYSRIMKKHDGDVLAAYEECKTTPNGFDPATFLAAHYAISTKTKSFDEPRRTDEGEVEEGIVRDETVDHGSALASREEPFDAVVARRELVAWLFTKVSDYERTLLKLRYGFDDLATENIRSAAGFRTDRDDLVMSDREVAQALGKTTPTIQRHRSAAERTMRTALDEAAAAETAA